MPIPLLAFSRQLELEPEDEVRVLFLGEQVSAVFLRGEEHAVLDLVALAGSILGAVGPPAVHPSGQVLAIEQRGESFLLRLQKDPEAPESHASATSSQYRRVIVHSLFECLPCSSCGRLAYR